jgi:hypothetical protein
MRRLILLALAACGSGGMAAGGIDASMPPASDGSSPVVVDAGADGATDCGFDQPGTLMHEMTLVVAAMGQDAVPGSNALVVPTPAARDAFAQTVVSILGGDESAACALPPSYRLMRMVDPTAGALRIVAEVDGSGNPAPSLFYGTFAAPATIPTPSRALVLEAPHPIFDIDTELEATAVFVQSAARMLLVAGAHRCADTAASACSGTTNACDDTTEAYRISDAAHTDGLPFNAIHALVSDGDASLQFLQLHGNGEPCPTALVSDCSGAWSDAGTAATLAAALVGGGVAIGECGAGYPTATCDLCGTDNVQARYTAGSAEACTELGSRYGRFVHVEQQLALRESPDGGAGGYAPLMAAVLATYPAQ